MFFDYFLLDINFKPCAAADVAKKPQTALKKKAILDLTRASKLDSITSKNHPNTKCKHYYYKRIPCC